MPYKVFISHSGKDTWVAQQIEKSVQDCGAGTFLDKGCIDIGDDFEDIIVSEIKQSSEIIVLLTPWALERSYVWMEVGAAWVLDLRQIFVLHGMTIEDIHKNTNIPVLIKKNNCIDLNDIQQYFSKLKTRVDHHET